METENRSFNELIFENRHKSYGAYAIRKSYNDHVTKALVYTASFFFLLAFSGIWVFKNEKELVDIDLGGPIYIYPDILPSMPVIPEKVDPPKLEKPPVTPRAESGQVEVRDDVENGLTKTNEEFNINSNSNSNVSDSAMGVTNEPEIFSGSVPMEPVKVPNQMPVLTNMDKFIADNLKYPQSAVDDKLEGTVYVSFVVEIDGSVTNVKLLRGIGEGCEEEAMRVVKMFPKWVPGIHNGKPARVQCNLPIKFTLK